MTIDGTEITPPDEKNDIIDREFKQNIEKFQNIETEKNNHDLLNIRSNITMKLAIFSFVLYMAFWYIFLGRVSRYLALSFSMLFLGFCVYNIYIYWRVQKEIRK